MLATRTVSDLLIVDVDAPFDTVQLLGVVGDATTPFTAGLIVSIPAAAQSTEAQLDALIALRKRSLRTWGDVRLVASGPFADHIRRRVGPWLTVVPSEIDAVRGLWPELTPPGTRMVGYWSNVRRPVSSPPGVGDERSPLPDPRTLVDAGWRSHQRERIAGYLRSGAVVTQSLGLSPCRFGCGSFGSTCLSDGDWQWPEGLVHYVDDHGLRLPDEFAESMAGNGWTVPADAEARPRSPGLEFWIGWASRQGSTPAEYGECVALAEDVRRVFSGDGFHRLWRSEPQAARRLRDLLRLASALGSARTPAADQRQRLISEARHSLEVIVSASRG